MHDIRAIRENPAAFDAAMARRGLSGVSASVLAIDAERRDKISDAEILRRKEKENSRLAGQAKGAGDEEKFHYYREEVVSNKQEMAKAERVSREADARLREILMGLPNLPLADIPDGKDEADNVEIHRAGTPPTYSFKPREHYDLPAVQGAMDFETAAKLSGSRFVVLKGEIARIHRALAQFMLDTHVTENGLTEMNTPVLVREEAMVGTGQLPKFGEDSYQTTNGWWLIPTSEVTLTNTVAETILDPGTLPLRMTAHSLCFRSEAGSAGRDTAGMLRQHQFEKVEMVSIVEPDQGLAELDRMTKCAEGILEKLGLAYRTVVLCTGDMGFGAQRTHDIEVWLPGQDTYREISSCSWCGTFQARRMNARYRSAEGAKPEFVGTLNGSGLAVGRCLIAVLENGQQEDGSVVLPPVLGPYLRGATRLTAEGHLV